VLEAPPKVIKTPEMNKIPRKRLLLILAAVMVITMATAYASICYTLSKWDEKRIAQLVGDTIHRQVKLGKSSWQFGIEGIQFTFASVAINELNGAPFIHSGESQFSLALTPLLRGQFFPTPLIFKNPEVWIVKLKDNKWNYSDLPNIDTTKYISRVLCLNGQIHVIDKSGSKSKNLDGLEVKNFKFVLNRPFGWFSWPFSMSCDIANTKYATRIETSGVGSGAFSDWKNSHHKWNIKVTGFDPAELTVFGVAPGMVQAPINLQLNGSGTLAKDLKTSLSFENPEINTSVKELRMEGNFVDFIPGLKADGQTAVLAKASGEEVSRAHTVQSAEATLDNLLTKELKGLSTSVNLQDASCTLKNPKTTFEISTGKLSLKNGVISSDEPVHTNFADGAVDVSGSYTSSHNYKMLVHLTSTDFNKVINFLTSHDIYKLAPQLRPVGGSVKSADLTITAARDKVLWNLAADPTGVFYKSPKEDKLLTLTGGTFNLDEKAFKLTNITGLLGATTPFKLNGTGSVIAAEPVTLNAVAQNVDLGTARKLLAILAIKLPASPADKMEGSCKQTDITLTGSQLKPELSLKGTIKQIYVQDKNKTRTFDLNAGDFKFEHNTFTCHQIAGTIGKGQFNLNGTVVLTKEPKLDLAFKAKDLDLSNVKVVLQDLKLDSPLMAEELLAGRVDDLDAHMKGSVTKPDITASLVPGDVAFEPLGAERPIHIKGGHVDLTNDKLKVDGVDVSTPRGSLNVSLEMDNLSKASELSKFSMKSPGLDIGDLNAYLVAERTPPLVREKYLAALKENEISEPKGKISGHMTYALSPHAHTPSISGQLHVSDLSSVVSGFAVQDVNGDVQADNNTLSFNGVKGEVGKSQFAMKGSITDFTNMQTRVWKVDLFSKISMQELARLAGEAHMSNAESGAQPIKIAAHIVGPEPEKKVTFTAQLDPSAAITFDTLIGPVAKPAGNEARIDGSMLVKANKVTLNDTHLKFGDVVLSVSGSVEGENVSAENIPKVEIKVRADDFVPLKTLVGFAPGFAKPEFSQGITGSIRGGMTAAGPANKLKIKGGAQVKDFSLPKFKLSQVNGKFRADDWVSITTPGGDTAVGQIPVSFEIPTARVEKLTVTNIKGKLISAPKQSWQYEVDGTLAKGTLGLTGMIDARTATCKAKLTNVSADDVLKDLFSAPNELTGTMNGSANLTCNNLSGDPIKTWTGSGTSTLANGRVARFSLLEKRVTQANLLKSGFLGFNLNNLLASVAPVEKGEFKTITTKFSMGSGILNVNEMLFKGDELHLRAKGKVDLSKRNLHFEVSGRVPRVSASGPLGSIAPLLGVGGITSTLEDIPEMFFMGKKASSADSAARVFAFSATAPLDKPDALSNSIYKSFHWLQGTASASAHPVLNVDSDQQRATAPKANAPGVAPASTPSAAPAAPTVEPVSKVDPSKAESSNVESLDAKSSNEKSSNAPAQKSLIQPILDIMRPINQVTRLYFHKREVS
jgi:hypothetical protein